MKTWMKWCGVTVLAMSAACGPGEEEEPSTQEPATSMCAADTDCKGERVCQGGSCVDPSMPSPQQDMGMTPQTTPDMSTPSQATCATTCEKVESCYPGQSTMAECVAACEQNFTQAQRMCVTDAATCADADQCVAGGPGPQPEPEPTTCLDSVQCESSEYCWYPAGAFEGQCQTNDFGKSCKRDSDCAYICVYDSSEDDFGQCTRECSASSECPESWMCREPGPNANFNSSFCDM